MYTLKDSYSFNLLNGVYNITEALSKVLKEYKIADNTILSKQLIDLKSQSTDIEKKALSAYNSDEIILYFSYKEKIMSNTIPFISIKKSDGSICTTSFLDIIGGVNTSSQLYKGDSESLSSLLQASYISGLIKSNGSSVLPMVLLKNILYMYENTCMNIVNSMSGIRAEQKSYDECCYFCRRFLLDIMANIDDNSGNESLSVKQLEFIDVDTIKKWEESKVTNFEELINLMKTTSNRLNNLNTRVFIDKYIQNYSQLSYLSFDNIEYLIFVIIAAFNNIPYISKQMKNIIKNTKGISSFIVNLNKI